MTTPDAQKRRDSRLSSKQCMCFRDYLVDGVTRSETGSNILFLFVPLTDNYGLKCWLCRTSSQRCLNNRDGGCLVALDWVTSEADFGAHIDARACHHETT